MTIRKVGVDPAPYFIIKKQLQYNCPYMYDNSNVIKLTLLAKVHEGTEHHERQRQ